MHNKLNNKESKSYVQGLRQFGNTLPRGVRGILKKNGYNYSEIISKWSALVGKDVSNYSYPKTIKMKNGNTNAMLVICIKRGNEINAEYSKKEIMDRINSYFGYKMINEIKIETISAESKKKHGKKKLEKFSKNFEKKIDKIKSENIKNALFQLLKVVKND